MIPTVILDRDGVINVDFGYVTSPERLELIPGAAKAIADLRQSGFSVGIISNQSAVGRGWASQDDVRATNEALCRELVRQNPLAAMDFIYFCPHGPAEGCECRKPKVGMAKTMLAQGDIDLERSWAIGDKLSDLGFGENLGIDFSRLILVLTGHGREELEKAHQKGQRVPRVCDNLSEAARLVLQESGIKRT